MNRQKLGKHANAFVATVAAKPAEFEKDFQERQSIVSYYQSFSKRRISEMNEEDVYDYLSRLWAMLIWGNKHYVVDKILADNGLASFKRHLAELLWGPRKLGDRWDAFRLGIKGMGPAMISEILCKTHPQECMLWNRRAYVALNYLEVEGLPRYDYQLTGDVYQHLCAVVKDMAKVLTEAGFEDKGMLGVDYFIWHELQVEDKLSQIRTKKQGKVEEVQKPTEKELVFVHDDSRDKLRDIGQWLGFQADTEKKVSEGARVDAVWEATIGNMGRVIYVFEVQTKGSIDSLIVNLLKSLNNPAVQGVVAVSDAAQLEKIRRHAQDVKELRDKLKYWDYESVAKIHESLEYVNAQINELELVPQGF